MELFNKDESNFYIIINRLDSLKNNLARGVPDTVGIYTMCTDGRNHWVEQKKII